MNHFQAVDVSEPWDFEECLQSMEADVQRGEALLQILDRERRHCSDDADPIEAAFGVRQ